MSGQPLHLFQPCTSKSLSYSVSCNTSLKHTAAVQEPRALNGASWNNIWWFNWRRFRISNYKSRKYLLLKIKHGRYMVYVEISDLQKMAEIGFPPPAGTGWHDIPYIHSVVYISDFQTGGTRPGGIPCRKVKSLMGYLAEKKYTYCWI
jgi:hypothetical protein